MARPLVTVYSTSGEAATDAALPAVFSAPIRRDVVQFAYSQMALNRRQAYAVSKYAGHQHSAESWGTGRAVSRIPRVSGSGTHRAGQGAFGNMCRKGRRFAPTRQWRRWHRPLAVGQRRYATVSAVAASGVPAIVMARGHRVSSVAEIPLVVDIASGSVSKTKDAVSILKAVGAYKDVEKAKASKKMRAGKGKMRGRRYVLRRGPLIVHNGDADLKLAFRNLPGVELCRVDALNLLQLAPGGHLGRFVVWTAEAFNRLDEIFGSVDEASEAKSGFKLPRAPVTNADLSRIINDPAVQSVVRRTRPQTMRKYRKKNPLRNKGVMNKLNPYAAVERRAGVLASQAGANTPRRNGGARSKAFFKSLTSDEWTFANRADASAE